MRRVGVCTSTVWTLFFCLVPLLATTTWAAGKVEVAMILWRGETPAEKGFKDSLSKSKDFTFTFTVFDADKSEANLQQIIDNLDRSKYRLIYTFGTTVTKTVKQSIQDLPIVFNIVSRPVKSGIIKSWESSGANITGASNAVPMTSAFRTLALVINIRKLGFIYNEKEDNSKIQKAEIEKQQEKFGFVMVDAPIKSQESIPETLKRVIDANPDAIMFPSDSMVKANADKLISVLNKHKIPTIVTIPGMVKDNGAMLALGPDYYTLGELAADNALQILEGQRPTDVPTRTVDSLHLTINLKTADRLGVVLPVQLLARSTVIK